jgi:hypothetical protein
MHRAGDALLFGAGRVQAWPWATSASRIGGGIGASTLRVGAGQSAHNLNTAS